MESIKGGDIGRPDTPVLQHLTANNMSYQEDLDSFPALLEMPGRYTVALPIVGEPLPEAYQGGAVNPENWENERHIIAAQVRKNAKPVSANDIVKKMAGHSTKLKPNHLHYRRAVEWMNGHQLPP